jgi:hypothetical protein
LTYYAKCVNIIAGGKGGGVVFNDDNLAIHNNYTAHNIVIDVKGKGFQFYTFTFG